jgi:hypothetical protein
MTAAKPSTERRPPSAAAPSPFPEYAFLSIQRLGAETHATAAA